MGTWLAKPSTFANTSGANELRTRAPLREEPKFTKRWQSTAPYWRMQLAATTEVTGLTLVTAGDQPFGLGSIATQGNQ